MAWAKTHLRTSGVAQAGSPLATSCATMVAFSMLMEPTIPMDLIGDILTLGPLNLPRPESESWADDIIARYPADPTTPWNPDGPKKKWGPRRTFEKYTRFGDYLYDGTRFLGWNERDAEASVAWDANLP